MITAKTGRVLGLALLLPFCAQAGNRSAVLVSSGTFGTGRVHANIPNSAPYNSSGMERVEMRIHNWTPPTLGGPNLMFALIHSCLEISIPHFGNTLLRVADNCDGNRSNDVRLDLTGRTDILLRIQRDTVNQRFTAEIWDVDRTHYSQGTNTMGTGSVVNNRVGSIEVAGEYASGNLAWLRWYSNVLSLNSPAPGEQAGADLGDWEFENNLTDSSGRGHNLTGGSFSNVNTPIYTPHCDAGPSQTATLGGGATLDGSRSFALQDSPLTYNWTFLGGPNTPTLINANSAQLSLTGLQSTILNSLSYRFQLTVEDSSGQSASCTTKLGVVTTDTSGVVLDAPPYASALGPVTAWGTSPWPWYDVTQKALGDTLTPSARPVPVSTNVSFEGTVSATADHPVHIVGTGTSFLNRLGSPVCVGTGTVTAQSCTITGFTLAPNAQIAFKPSVPIDGAFTLSVNGGPAVPVGSGTYNSASHYPLSYNGSSFNRGWFGMMYLWWSPTGYPANSGRMQQSIATIEDDTHLTLTDYGIQLPISQVENVPYGRMDLSNENFAMWGFGSLGGSNNWNYYDNVLAKYRLWMRTGIDDYLQDARQLADDWWVVGIDHGDSPLAPRVTGLHGMIVRALDGKPEMWPGILSAADAMQNIKDPTTDTREAAYVTRYHSLLARYAPNSGTRAQFCSILATNVRDQWVAKQTPQGFWPQDLYGNNHDYPFQGTGTLPYMLGLAMHGLRYTHEAMISTCNDSETGYLTLNALMKAASFLKNYSQGSNRGLFYAVQYGSYATEPAQLGSGSASTTPGSNTIQLTGGSATTFFSCNGTDFIGIDALSKVYKVLGCPNASQVQVDATIPIVTSGAYRRAVKMATNCAPALATTCADYSPGTPADPAVGDRNILGDTKASFGYLFSVTGDLKYIEWGDDFMGADYGGPKAGPGNLTTPCPGDGCAGPGADGNTGAYATALPPCNVAAPPCGGFGVLSGLGKYYGMADGAGDTPNYLAFRTGSALARTVYVDAPWNEATQVRITAQQFSGPSTQTCSTRPCAVLVDGGLESPRVTIEYLKSGQTLAKSVPELLLH